MRSLAAGALLLWRFGEAEILEDEYGKPRLANGPHFSLSHSGDYAVLAVDGSPVGVDIEMHGEGELREMARAAFHPLELAAWSLNAAVDEFFDIWTLKESYCKMIGLGLFLDPRSFCLRLENGEYGVVGDETAALRLYHGFPGYSLALCSRSRDWPLAATEITPRSLRSVVTASTMDRCRQ